MTKIPKIPKVYPNDTNLLSFMFSVARNDRLLTMLLTEIQFIRDNPQITEEQVRRQTALDALNNMPHKGSRKPVER